MAIPFYNQGDQEIHASGNQYIPQEQYRLGPYTPPEIMGQNTTAGIVNTQAAGSYMGYPSYEAWLLAQGGGGGGGDGPDQIEEDKFSMGMSPGAMGGKLPGFGNWAKRTAGTHGHAYSQLPTPTNLLRKGIRHWKEKRDARRVEEAAASKAATDQAEKTASGVGPTTGQGGAINPGDLKDIGGGFHEYTDSGTAAGYEGSFAQGGRIGLRPGGIVDAGKQYYGMEDWEIQQINKYGVSYPQFLQNQYGKGLHELNASQIALAVKAWDTWRASQAEGGRIGLYAGGDPEEPAEDIREIMQDQNIPFSEQVEGDAFQMRIQELMGKGLSYDDAYDIAEMEFQDLFAEGSEQDQGIASLV